MSENSILSPERRKFDFSALWFESNIPTWRPILSGLTSKKINVLEIGPFEGASTTWILEELLSHPESKMTTVDTFRGSIEQQTSEKLKSKLETLEQRFRRNIDKTGRGDRLTVIKGKSYDALINLSYAKSMHFDFIYIDGSHTASDVLSDAVLSWPLLSRGGIMIFDDYEWDRYKELYNKPRIAIDSFLECYGPELELIHKGYQIAIKKVRRRKVFTENRPGDSGTLY